MSPDRQEYELRGFGLEGPYLEGIAAVYESALGLEWSAEYPGFRHYIESFSDFFGLVALAEDTVVGVGWGTGTQPGEWLFDRVAAQIGREHPALQDAWLLSVLAVLPSHRGRGIGSRLHDALLEAQPRTRALVCTSVENGVARRLYEHQGWEYFRPDCVIEAGKRRLVVLHKEVAEMPRAGAPEGS